MRDHSHTTNCRFSCEEPQQSQSSQGTLAYYCYRNTLLRDILVGNTPANNAHSTLGPNSRAGKSWLRTGTPSVKRLHLTASWH